MLTSFSNKYHNFCKSTLLLIRNSSTFHGLPAVELQMGIGKYVDGKFGHMQNSFGKWNYHDEGQQTAGVINQQFTIVQATNSPDQSPLDLTIWEINEIEEIKN